MKTVKLFITMLMLVSFVQIFTQVREQYSANSRKFIFNLGGLVNTGNEIFSPLSDSSITSFSYGQKTSMDFEGTYYQVLQSNKHTGTESKIVIRKSTDGVNWSVPVRAGDALLNKSEYHANLYVWRKGANVNIGVMYAYWGEPNPEIRYALSTNAGISFLPSVKISSHTDNFTIFCNGISGKGDTIMINWVRQYGGDRCDETWFSRTTNGGINWSPMAIAYPGNHYSFITDIALDDNGNAWSVTADDQFFRVNPVIRFTSNLGASWETRTQIVDMPSGHTNTNIQLRAFGSKLYAIWTHTQTYADSVNFSVSTNGGNSWSTKKISDTDTIFNLGGSQATFHPSFSVSSNGHIYAVWPDSRERHAPTVDSSYVNVYLTRSTDGGVTWSPNMKVNGPRNYSRVTNAYPNVMIRSNGQTDTVLVVWGRLRNIIGLRPLPSRAARCLRSFS